MTPVLLPRPILNPDRRANKPKRLPDLVFQKPLIRKVQLHRAISKEHKCRRRDSRLRHVFNLHSLAYWDRSTVEVNRPQEAVHFAGGNALAALRSHFLDQRKNFLRPLARVRGEKQHWS